MKLITIIIAFSTLTGCHDTGVKPTSHHEELVRAVEPSQESLKVIEPDLRNPTQYETEIAELSSQDLEPIKSNFHRINQIRAWTSVEERELYQTTEGGEAKCYFINDTLLKVVATYYGETGRSLQKFYINNRHLSFVSETNYLYNRPITWDSIVMENNNDTEVFDPKMSTINESSNYFVNNILIKQTRKSDSSAVISKNNLKEESVRLKRDFYYLKSQLEK